MVDLSPVVELHWEGSATKGATLYSFIAHVKIGKSYTHYIYKFKNLKEEGKRAFLSIEILNIFTLHSFQFYSNSLIYKIRYAPPATPSACA